MNNKEILNCFNVVLKLNAMRIISTAHTFNIIKELMRKEKGDFTGKDVVDSVEELAEDLK